jgi:phage protein D
MAAQDNTKVTDVWVKCGALAPIPDHEIKTMVVDLDMDHPDMCVLTLANSDTSYSHDVALGDEVEIKIGGSGGETIFKGEVAGVEPSYRTGSDTQVVVRAFNRLHRLLRGRKSRTFLDRKDSDIAQTIASDNGLTADVDATSIAHKHVYQHNQTDMEFLRQRAARNGYRLAVDDKALHFKKPTSEDSGIELRLNDPDAEYMLKSFHPRVSSANIVQEVEVRGWDPEKKQEIVARVKAPPSSLGKSGGTSKAEKPFGQKVAFTVDVPVASVEEAKAIAESHMSSLAMDYITGEGTMIGSPKIKAGTIVKITVNPDKPDYRFNGKYMVVGVSHRYKHSSQAAADGGYTTAIRVKRDAEGGA